MRRFRSTLVSTTLSRFLLTSLKTLKDITLSSRLSIYRLRESNLKSLNIVWTNLYIDFFYNLAIIVLAYLKELYTIDSNRKVVYLFYDKVSIIKEEVIE